MKRLLYWVADAYAWYRWERTVLWGMAWMEFRGYTRHLRQQGKPPYREGTFCAWLGNP